jgi:hypothetical protein
MSAEQSPLLNHFPGGHAVQLVADVMQSAQEASQLAQAAPSSQKAVLQAEQSVLLVQVAQLEIQSLHLLSALSWYSPDGQMTFGVLQSPVAGSNQRDWSLQAVHFPASTQVAQAASQAVQAPSLRKNSALQFSHV